MVLYYLSSGPLPITMDYGTLLPSCHCLLYYSLLAHCLSLWYFTSFFWSTAYAYVTLLSVHTHVTLQPSTGSLPISLVLFYLLLAHCLYLCYFTTVYLTTAYAYLPPISMVLYFHLPDPCLSIWYSNIFYLPTAYHFGTLLPSSGPLPTLLSSTGHCLYL